MWQSWIKILQYQWKTTPTSRNWLKSTKEPALPNSGYRCRGSRKPPGLSLLIRIIQAMIKLWPSLKVQQISSRSAGRTQQMWSLVSSRVSRRSSRWPRQPKHIIRDRLPLEGHRFQTAGTKLSLAHSQSLGYSSLATNHLRWWSPDRMRRGGKLHQIRTSLQLKARTNFERPHPRPTHRSLNN